MNKILMGLKKPYPLEERIPAQIKLAFIFGLIVFMLMYFVKPFGFKGNRQELLINSIYAGALTAVAICFDFLLLFPLFPNFFNEEKWTIGREIIFTFLIITTIASFNVLAGKFIWGFSLSFINWLKMIFFTGLIGIAPATISILLNQARLLKKYRKEVVVINEHLTHSDEQVIDIIKEINDGVDQIIIPVELPKNIETSENTADEALAVLEDQIIFTAENEKENLSINSIAFLAATSADNYIKLFYVENNKLKTSIIRSTLKKAEENSLMFSNIFRCHRTALINLTHVEKVNGTAQGYRLKIAFMLEEIPVSRNLNRDLKERLASINMTEN